MFSTNTSFFVKATAHEWLGNWAYCLPFTVNSTLIDADLTNFPVYVNLTNTDVFYVIGDSWLKIAVADENASQAYVEVVSWNATTENAEIWTSLNVTSSVDSTFYLYFDNNQLPNSDYVAEENSVVAAKVWNSNYALVCHMKDYGDASHTVDSTSNNVDGAKKGAGEPAQATGIIGSGQDFAGDDDLINLGDNIDLGVSNLTISMWVKTTQTGGQTLLVDKTTWVDVYKGYKLTRNANSLYAIFGDGTTQVEFIGTSIVNDGSWHRVCLVLNRSGNGYLLVDGGSAEGTQDISAYVATDIQHGEVLVLGSVYWGSSYYDGLMDEVRFSTLASSTWEKASYYSESELLLTEGFVENYVEATPTPEPYTSEEIIGFSIALTITFFSVVMVFALVRRRDKN